VAAPLTWVSRLQTEIALSTTEAEYIALSQAMRDILPARALLKEIGTNLSLSFSKKSLIKSKVWEDNNGALHYQTRPLQEPSTLLLNTISFAHMLALTLEFTRSTLKNSWQMFLPRACQLRSTRSLLLS